MSRSGMAASLTARNGAPKLRARCTGAPDRVYWAGSRPGPIQAGRPPAWSPSLPISLEFSRRLAPEHIPAEGTSVHLAASPVECALLARRFELVDLTRLEGDAQIVPVAGTSTIHVTGHLSADVVQTCVVTLEPVPALVEADFDRLFSSDLPYEAEEEVEIDPESEAPEPIAGGTLDLGEILAEELSLAMEPYPRSPDADRLLAEREAEASGGQRSPFTALDSLRRH